MNSGASETEFPTPVNTTTWVIIPLYNEEQVIGSVIENVLTQFSHVVCVDDGSSDNSAFVAKAAGARVLKHPVNLGQGAALQTGISYAVTQPDVDFVVTFDADGQHRLIDAVSMVELARKKYLDIVFGSRFLDNRTKPGLIKKIVLKTAVIITNFTSGLKLTDAHNGLRVLSLKAASKLQLKQDRMAHASEIVAQLGKMNLPWQEYPVEVLYTDYSKAKGQSVFNSINILVDLMVD